MKRFAILVMACGWGFGAQAQMSEPAPLSLSPQDTIELNDPEQLSSGTESSLQQRADLVETRFGDWFQICVADASPRRCEVVQTMQMQTEEGLAQLLQTVFARADQGLLVVQKTLPNGLDLRPGIAIQLGEFPEFNQPFLTCSSAGCTVAYAFTADQVEQLLSVQDARIGIRPLNSEQTLVIEMSFDGLADALEPLLNP